MIGVYGCGAGFYRAMVLRSPIYLAGFFLVLASIFSVYFNSAIRIDADAAAYRFDQLFESGAHGRAARQGERTLALYERDERPTAEIASLKTRLAASHIEKKRHSRGAELLRDALNTQWAEEQSPRRQIMLEEKLARAEILSGNIVQGISVYASFLDLAGDAATPGQMSPSSLSAFYASQLDSARDLFRDKFNHAAPRIPERADRSTLLATSNQLAQLGAYYALRDDGKYAAAGLLATGYEIRKKLLGVEDPDTVQLAMILGPVLGDMGRINEKVALYHEAFLAQERLKGSNSPDLSLYIKLLADTYVEQGRMTEAQAMYDHMRNLFQDAFGDQRYAVNRERDRREDINRPVSQYFTLPDAYAPTDLVSVGQYSVPTGKSPNIDEMKLRLAADNNEDPREANLPVRLAQLVSLCTNDSGERVSLRSGYRSYETQAVLHKRNGNKGTVTPPGMSEHQTGLAADINVNNRFMRQSDRAYQCFEENAFRFGFILSYPPGNDYLPGPDTYEPWHWRYVGIQTAQLYREIGPHQKPQEFLAALPCYQERAANGIFPLAGEADICLTGPVTINVAASEPEPAQPPGENTESARILNDQGVAGTNR